MNTWDLKLDELKDKQLLLAHSGGLDSSVLAFILLREKIQFSVAHCNFQLRGKESDEDLNFVKKWCDYNEVTLYAKVFEAKIYKEQHKLSTQEAARELRYDWFYSLMNQHGMDGIVTGHHLNDQLETFLINATRGTGVSGLLGILSKNKLYRPLRMLSRKQILSIAQKNKIHWREDASNAELEYLRNQIRHQVITPLEKIKPNALSNFKTTLNHLSETDAFLQEHLDLLKSSVFEEQHDRILIDISSLKNQNHLKFCLYHWFSPYGFEAKEVLKLLDASIGKRIESSTHRLIFDRTKLILTHLGTKQIEEVWIDLSQKEAKLPLELSWETNPLEIKSKWNSNEAFLDKDGLKNPLQLRKYQKGDYFYPTGMKGKKLLSKFFKDEKYSLIEKEQQWLLCSGDAIVWVIGKRCDRRFTVRSQTKNKLLMRLEK